MATRTRTTRERTILTAERDARAAHLRAQGRTYRQIAAEIGVSAGNAYMAVQRAIASTPVEAVTELRQIECARLDAVIAKLWDLVEDESTEAAAVISALAGIVRASESKRKLLGLDAPSRQTLTVVTRDTVEQAIAELEAQLADNDPVAAAR